MAIVVDELQVEAVLGSIMKRFEKGGYPYNHHHTVLPHDRAHLPKTLKPGGRQHAMFLFVLCYYMRGGINSVTAAKALGRMYDATRAESLPDIFRSEVAAKADPNEVTALMRRFGLGFQSGQIGGFWVENAKRLQKLWQGDPRKIMAGVDNYNEACRRIKNDKHGSGFQGFQEKMVSMLLYYLMDEELIDFFYFPIPIDLHVMRVAVANELVRFDDIEVGQDALSEELLATLRQLFVSYAQVHGINPLRLCDAIWLLGSALCGLNPGNEISHGSYNARSTVLTPVELEWNEARLRSFERSCGACPVRATCKWDIPSAYYYRQGQLIRLRRRSEPPVQSLFSVYAGLDEPR